MVFVIPSEAKYFLSKNIYISLENYHELIYYLLPKPGVSTTVTNAPCPSQRPTCAQTWRVTPAPTLPENAPTVKHSSSGLGLRHSLSRPSSTLARLDLPEPVGPSTMNLATVTV